MTLEEACALADEATPQEVGLNDAEYVALKLLASEVRRKDVDADMVSVLRASVAAAVESMAKVHAALVDADFSAGDRDMCVTELERGLEKCR